MSLPKYFKDPEGFCYVATELLAKQEGMTPWDGAVDARGYALDQDADPAEPKAKLPKRARGMAAPADAEGSPTGE